jgi:DNA mismatch repair protein MutS2
MKLTVPLTEIESLDGKKVEPPPKSVSKPASLPAKPAAPVMVRTTSNTLDIRGKRIDEAESLLEPAIAQATEAGVLWIVHGKGTGRLRQGVQDFLERHPQVERFELAPQNEGGAGVTLAFLR